MPEEFAQKMKSEFVDVVNKHNTETIVKERSKSVENYKHQPGIYLGKEAMSIGLIDGYGTIESVIEEHFPGLKTKTIRGQTRIDSMRFMMRNMKVKIGMEQEGPFDKLLKGLRLEKH